MAFITILHKRSNVEDRRPTTEDLFEGELALNTFDGKLFFKTVKNGVEDVIEIGENFDGQYSNLTGAPTLLSSFTNDPGYITDYTVTLADVTQHESGITITESQISDLQNYLTAVSFGQVTDKPTTLAGYGITDAATAAQGALADTALQPGRNISTLQNNVGYLTSVSNTDVTQHQTDIIITESQISDLRPYLLSVSSSDVTQHQADLQLIQSQITDFYVSNNDVTQHQSEIRITESQITDLKTYATADNAMNFTNKTGNITQWTNDANYITNAQEINDLTANVTWTTVPDPFISQSAVVQHEGQLVIFENQIGDLQAYLTAVSNTDVTQHQSDIRLNQSQIVDFAVTNTDVTQHQTDIRITESQITDLQAYLTSETTTSLVANTVSQELLFTDETGAVNSVDLSWAVDDTNLARLVSGTLDANTGIATFTRDDASTFTVNFNPLFDDTNLTRINSASFNTADGVLTLTRTDATEVTVDLDGRFLTEVTNTAVTAHQSDLQITESQITDLQAYITDYTVTVADVTQHQGALQILESQVVGLGPYAPLSNGVVPDANISNTSIIQHQSELTITESQISDLGSYLTVESDPVYSAEKGQPSGTATLDGTGKLLDQFVSANNVVQHEAALTITESQISDLQTYLTAETDTLDDVIGRGATTTTTAVIPFLYANQAAFPNASTYHGAIAHSHADGAMYFAHGGVWNKLANDSQLSSYLTASDIANMVETTDSVSVLSDVDTTGAADGSILAYDNSTSTWKVNSGATSSVIAPFAFASVNTTSNGSGKGISWSNWNSSNHELDFTFDTAQPDTNYAVITDSETFDDYFVGISNKTVNGFTASFYDDAVSRTPSGFAPFSFVVYGSNPTNHILGTGNLSTDLTISNATPGTAGIAYDSGNTALIFTPPDLSSYLTSVSNTDVTQYESDIRITESQITDLQSYLTAESDTLDTVTGRGATTSNAITVGNLTSTGIDDNASSTAITITGTGRVGIDNTSPASFPSDQQHLVIGSGSGNVGATIYSGTTGRGNLKFADGTTLSDSIKGAISYDHSADSLTLTANETVGLTINSSGTVVIESTANTTSASTGALVVDGGVGIAGDLYVGGTITELSSIRYKENVRDLDASIIPQLRPVLYDEKDSDGKDIPGLIAEEVAEVCTNVVSYNEEGNPEGLQYSRLIPYLIDHIQKLEKRIEDLEKNG